MDSYDNSRSPGNVPRPSHVARPTDGFGRSRPHTSTFPGFHYPSTPSPISHFPPIPPPIPSSLIPGRSRGHSIGTNPTELFFQPTDFHSIATQRSMSRPYNRHSTSAPIISPPPVPRKPFSRSETEPPPVPPKPKFPESPLIPQKEAVHGPSSSPYPLGREDHQSFKGRSRNGDPLLSDETEDQELALALALSASEADISRMNQTIEEDEDEEFSRALRQSLLDENPKPFSTYPVVNQVDPMTSYFYSPTDTHMPIPPSPPSEHRVLAHVSTSTASPRRFLQGLPEESLAEQGFYNEGYSTPQQSGTNTQLVSTSFGHSQTDHASVLGPNHIGHPMTQTSTSRTPPPPVSRPISSPSTSSYGNVTSESTSPTADSLGNPAVSARPITSTLTPLPASLRPLSIPRVSSRPVLRPVGEQYENGETRTESLVSTPVNQFIEPDLLLGFSLGFSAPTISTEVTMMTGPVPNIITLPLGKCPPLHLQAPSWRHLLKLMARLSGTRIEPTVEAMAVTKTVLKLRTVIQFVKVHHSSLEWRTIIWLTLDHPVPPGSPGAWKYTNSDVSVLPYSYSLSNIPALLRDSEDQMSRIYTVPSSSTTPYPALPISFPNMALYLQSALDDSRRASHDSSSSLRRLSKTIDLCYPNQPTNSGECKDASERTVGGLFKRVIGRGNRQSRGGNEDTFELVTPFVPDEQEWG